MKNMPKDGMKRAWLGPTIVLCALIAGCSPPYGYVGTFYTYSISAPKSLVLATPPGIGCPAWSTPMAAPALGITGTPAGNDFGYFPLTASGTYTNFWGNVKPWTYSDQVYVYPPSAPTVTTITIPFSAAAGVTATVTATPAATYIFSLSSTDPNLVFPTSVTSNAGGTATYTVTNNLDVVRTSHINVTITPTGSGAQPLSTLTTVDLVQK